MLDEADYLIFDLAESFSRRSKDHTKVGCVIRSESPARLGRVRRMVKSYGWNTLPTKMPAEFITSPDKNKYMIHAEVNAILNFMEHGVSSNASIYIWGLFPCSACAALIAHKGIRHCYAVEAAESQNKEKWRAEAEHSKYIFDKCGVNYHFMTLLDFECEKELHFK